jgi:hypothetical protein
MIEGVEVAVRALREIEPMLLAKMAGEKFSLSSLNGRDVDECLWFHWAAERVN